MFNPVNRYILIEVPKTPDEVAALSIVLPEDYQAHQGTHATVSVLKAAKDVRFPLDESANLVVDRSMIEEITVGGTIYNVILDNYVVGIVD
jgi:hypothetical protein